MAQEQEAARKAAEDIAAAAEATRALATAAMGILSCPLPPYGGAPRKVGRAHADPPPASRWPGGVTDALEDEDIAAAFGMGNGHGGKIGAAWFTAGEIPWMTVLLGPCACAGHKAMPLAVCGNMGHGGQVHGAEQMIIDILRPLCICLRACKLLPRSGLPSPKGRLDV